jgi:hypothetical protein
MCSSTKLHVGNLQPFLGEPSGEILAAVSNEAIYMTSLIPLSDAITD